MERLLAAKEHLRYSGGSSHIGSRYSDTNADKYASNVGHHKLDPKLRKRIGEFLILGIYLLIDAFGFWSFSHFRTLAIASVGIVALLIHDEGISWFMVGCISLMVVLFSFVIYFIFDPLSKDDASENLSPIPLEDVKVYGKILPGELPSPPSSCGNESRDVFRILIGDNTIEFPVSLDHYSVFSLGVCGEVLGLSVKNGTVLINAQLNDGESSYASIEENKIISLNGDNYVARQNAEKNKFTVRSASGRELFFSNFYQ